MRIATSTIYSQQSIAMDNLEAQYQTEGEALSTGKTLNGPSDDPTQIGEDLQIRSTIKIETQQTTDVQNATEQLTSTDSALANLTSILQSTQQVATSAVNTLVSPTELKDMGAQVDEYLQQTIAIANTQYDGAYVFAGTAKSASAPVTTIGSPVSAVNFSGNEQSASQMLYNGQSFSLSPTMQQAFNYGATDGSPSVFQTLINLRDTLDQGLVTDQSAKSINRTDSIVYGASSPTPTTLNSSPSPFTTTPVADSAGDYSISINNTDAHGIQHVEAYTFYGTTAVDSSSALSITGAINANTATTGLSATFDAQTQRLTLTNAGGGSFNITDTASPGATTTANLTSVFELSGTASLPQTVSTQLGDIQNALGVTLNARAVVGSRMNALSQIDTQVSSDINDNTTVQSNIEDTNIATASTQFSATQTALTASYSTTTRLEAKDLFDYLS
jgi:flagellar hook-associated protein 3